MLVVKRGPMGCAVIDGAIPASLDDAFNGTGVRVEVLNVLGAGDAFSAGFLSGWVRGEDYDACARYANACGALVVSRHGCAPAMPTRVELDYFIANAERIPRPDQDATLTRLHRVTAPRTPRDEVLAFAFDHRNQFFELAQQAGADEARIPRLKQLFVEAVAEVEAARGLHGRIGMLCDDRYGQDALNAATGRGWWIGRPVELPGSNPLVFDRGRSIGTTLIELAAGARRQVPRAVSTPTTRSTTGSSRKRRSARCTTPCRRAATSCCSRSFRRRRCRASPTPCYRALKRLYNLGIYPEWWKLEPMDAAQWAAIDALIAERDPYCRGVRAARARAPASTRSRRRFATRAAARTCRGFAVGRTMFQEPSRAMARRRDRRCGARCARSARTSRR